MTPPSPRARPAPPPAPAVPSGCSSRTTRTWSAPDSASSSTPSRTSPWSPRPVTARRPSRWPAASGRTCACWTSGCPKLDGLEATRLLAGPGVADPLRVVVVTTFDLDEYVYGALRGGACGFLLKDSGTTLLAEAVRAAAAGDSLVSPSVTVRLLRLVTAAAPADSAPRPASPAPGAPLQEPLTERELDVVRLVAPGRTNAEITAELYVSLSTVKTHLSSVQLKPAARNRVEIAAWAWQNGHARPGT